MTDPFHSPLWYRVADLKPALVSHARVRRHVYRGSTWYVIQDQSSGRTHRFTPVAYHFIGLMDGQASVDQVMNMSEKSLGDDALTQTEAIELLSRLHAADLLKAEVTPDTDELFRRHRAQAQQKWKQRLWSPLSVRFPLIDPDRFLDRIVPLCRPLFGWVGLSVWLCVVCAALVLAGTHWPELTDNVVDRILTPGNVIAIWLSYPVIKILHELGHAVAAKYWGGEIHEMGIMLLVLMPMPYVDASSASAFPDKRKRMAVSAAGILVELFVASLALFIWVAVEPGVVRSLAFNVMFIGGVSTVFFNGNPLLRFDGYYIFSDLLDIPNLAARSRQYLGYLCQRFLFGRPDCRSPAMAPGERAWLAGYALSSFIYRMVIIVAIVLFVATKFFVVGVILAIWAAITQLLIPLVKQIGFVLIAPELQRNRGRAVGTTGFVVAAIAGLFFFVPVPLWTVAEGVVWAPQNSEVRAQADALVVRLVAVPNSLVETGEPLFETEDPELAGRVAILEADLAEAAARYGEARTSSRVEAEIIKDEIETVEAELALARERLEALTVRSPAAGLFLVDRPQDIVGRHVNQGDLIAYVADEAGGTVQVVVSQDDIGLIRQHTSAVRLRLSERLDRPVRAQINRAVPLATDHLPSAVLGTLGGGELAVDPGDPRGVKVLQEIFQIELKLDDPATRLGGRAYVRFDHGSEPLAHQWYRRARQLFLRRFHV
jgi:putative peptide zinc metalloprotease protein